jgi:hypothetical protein
MLAQGCAALAYGGFQLYFPSQSGEKNKEKVKQSKNKVKLTFFYFSLLKLYFFLLSFCLSFRFGWEIITENSHTTAVSWLCVVSAGASNSSSRMAQQPTAMSPAATAGRIYRCAAHCPCRALGTADTGHHGCCSATCGAYGGQPPLLWLFCAADLLTACFFPAAASPPLAWQHLTQWHG